MNFWVIWHYIRKQFFLLQNELDLPGGAGGAVGGVGRSPNIMVGETLMSFQFSDFTTSSERKVTDTKVKKEMKEMKRNMLF